MITLCYRPSIWTARQPSMHVNFERRSRLRTFLLSLLRISFSVSLRNLLPYAIRNLLPELKIVFASHVQFLLLMKYTRVAAADALVSRAYMPFSVGIAKTGASHKSLLILCFFFVEIICWYSILTDFPVKTASTASESSLISCLSAVLSIYFMITLASGSESLWGSCCFA